MPDQEFDVAPREVPGRRDRYLDDEERRIHAPGGSVVVTVPIVMPGDRGHRDRWDGNCPPDGQLPVPPPASLPLTGTELFDMFQSSATFPFWRRVTTNTLDFLRQYFPIPFTWKALSAKADIPPTTLFSSPNLDMIYELTISVATKTQDAGAGTGTATILFTSLDGTASPLVKTCDLTTAGDGDTSETVILIAPGTPVVFSFAAGGPYGNASYDFIITATPRSSSIAINQPNNIFYA